MRSHDWRDDELDEGYSGHRKHKPKTNSYHAWSKNLERRDKIENLKAGLGVTVKYASVILGLIAVMSIPGTKNTPSERNAQPVEASEKFPTNSPEKVATILSATSIVK